MFFFAKHVKQNKDHTTQKALYSFSWVSTHTDTHRVKGWERERGLPRDDCYYDLVDFVFWVVCGGGFVEFYLEWSIQSQCRENENGWFLWINQKSCSGAQCDPGN